MGQKVMPDGIRSVEPLEATKGQLERNFKTIGLRKKTFNEQKLRNYDYQFELTRKQRRKELAAEAAKAAEEAAPGTRRQRPEEEGERDAEGGLGRSQSSPLLDFGPGGRGSGLQDSNRWTASASAGFEAWNTGPAPRTPGMSCGRFGAQYPTMAHPAVHPGAVDLRHSTTMFRPPSPQTPGGGRATASRRGCSASAGSSVTMSAPPSPGLPHHSRGLHAPMGVAAEDLTDEDRFLAAMEAEDTTFLRHTHSADALDSLGGLIALLGPRYKFMPRAKLWEKAEILQMTPFQRRMRREQEKMGILGTSAASLIPQAGSQGRRKPEDAQDNDPDNLARRRLIHLRSVEKSAALAASAKRSRSAAASGAS